MAALIARSLGLDDIHKTSSLWSIFKALTASDVIRMIGGMGLAGLTVGKRAQRTGHPKPLEVAKSAANVLSNWPINFHALLDRAKGTHAKGHSLPRAFGWVYRRVLGQGACATLMPEAAQAIIVPEFVSYLDRTWVGEAAIPRQALEAPEDAKWVSREEAARRLNIHENTVTKMYKEGQLAGKLVKGAQRSFLFVSTDDVTRLAAAAGSDRSDFKRKYGAITFKEASEIFCLSVAHVRQLVAAGHVDELRRFTSVYVSRASLEQLIRKLEDLVVRSTTDPWQLIGISRIVQGQKRLNIASFIDALLKREISPVHINSAERGFRKFLFEREDVEAVVRNLVAGDNFVNGRTATEMIRATQFDIPRLVKAKLLVQKGPSARGVPLRICVTSIHRFKDRYGVLSEIADAYDTQPNGMNSQLRSKGVIPALDSDGNGTRSYWEWDEVEAVFAKPHSTCRK